MFFISSISSISSVSSILSIFIVFSFNSSFASHFSIPSNSPLISLPQPMVCEPYHEMIGNINYYRQVLSGDRCWLSVVPYDYSSPELIYRSYLMTEDGVFMVFNSYGQGSISTDTGARIFQIFPRNQLPHAYVTGEKLVIKTAYSNLSLIMDSNTGLWAMSFGAEIKEDPMISKKNKGGVEWTHMDTFYVDFGFSIGHDPRANANALSTVFDSKNHSCSVKNKELFKYDADQDFEFKFLNDQDLVEFLKIRCQNLDLSPLL